MLHRSRFVETQVKNPSDSPRRPRARRERSVMAARSRAGLWGTIVGLLVGALTVSSASADDFRTSGATCAAQVTEQPFLQWLDPASYVLVPGGTFEPGLPGWQLGGGAMVASGNEPFYVHGQGER